MTAKLTLYIVRHSKTIMNTLDRVQGWCDSPLTTDGKLMAEHLGYGLKDIKFRNAYCSDLRRTRETAKNILLPNEQSQNIPIIELEGLREACFGSFEADFNKTMWGNTALLLGYVNPEKMYQDLFSKKINYSKVLDTIKKLDQMGMAENFHQVKERTQKSLLQIAEKESSKDEDANILIVAHGLSILCMLNDLGGDTLLKSHLENASVCKVEYRNKQFEVLSMGDLSYLQKGQLLYENITKK